MNKNSAVSINEENSVPNSSGISNSLFWSISTLILLMGGAFVYFVNSIFISGYDLGLIPIGADLISRGGLLYRDLHTVMWPGSYLWLALIFSIFGSTIWVCQIVASVSIVSISFLLLVISRKFLRSYEVFIPAIFYLVLGSVANPYVSHHWDSLFLLLCFCLLLLRINFEDDVSMSYLAFTGLVGGLSVVFYQNQILPVICGVVLVSIVFFIRSPGSKSWIGKTTCLLGGIGFPIINLLGFALCNGTLESMIDCTVTFVLAQYGHVNQVLYGWSNIEAPVVAFSRFPWIVLTALPFGVIKIAPFVVLGAVILYRIKFGTFKDLVRRNPTIFLLFGLAIGLWVSELHKPDLKRLIFGEPLIFICFFYLITLVKYKSARILLSSFTFLVAAGLMLDARAIVAMYPADSIVSYMTRRGEVKSLVDLTVLEKLQAHTRPYEKILVYPYDTGILFLSKASYPDRFPVLQYGYHSPEQFAAVLEDMDLSRVKYVLVNMAMTEQFFLDSGFASYKKPDQDKLIVEPYLKKHFKPVKVYGVYRLLERKEPANN